MLEILFRAENGLDTETVSGGDRLIDLFFDYVGSPFVCFDAGQALINRRDVFRDLIRIEDGHVIENGPNPRLGRNRRFARAVCSGNQPELQGRLSVVAGGCEYDPLTIFNRRDRTTILEMTRDRIRNRHAHGSGEISGKIFGG